MISKTAVETLEEMKAKGLEPSFADIIRLNVLGLRLEAARKKHAADSTYYLPRVAQVSEKLAFRQPTIGHEVWLDKVERFVAKGDYNTLLAVKAFALSRPPSELPDPDSPASINKAIEAFCVDCRELSRDQIYAAVEYVVFGSDAGVGVYAANRSSDEDQGESEDYESCISIGVMNEGRAALWGITQAEMRDMTRQQLQEVIRRSYLFHKMETHDEVDRLEGDFYATADEIVDRLQKEKENG